MGHLVGVGRVSAVPGLLPPGVRVRDGDTELIVDEWLYRARGYHPPVAMLPALQVERSAANENGSSIDETQRAFVRIFWGALTN